MGKRTLITGIIVGASLGGLVSLLNGDAREYAKEKVGKCQDNLSYYTKNPTEAVQFVKQTVLSLNNTIESNTGSAVSALETVENSLQKVLKK